ncbi:MAG: hypothetical protein LBI14_03525 [Treponema sp.]|jgi:hypothetical protein|nr:hypothetical protein [Treponema sp.]
MKKMFIIFIVLLQIGCSKNEENSKENIQDYIVDNIVSDSNLVNRSISNLPIHIPEEIVGTYLSKEYLYYLKELKSHIISINKVHNDQLIVKHIDEVIISNEILFIYNLHEGTTHRIKSFENNNLTIDNSPFSGVPYIPINNGVLLLVIIQTLCGCSSYWRDKN